MAFYRPIFLWMLGLVGLSLSAWLVSPEAGARPWTFWGGLCLFLGWISLFLPCVTFAGGLANSSPVPTRAVTMRSLGIAVIFYGSSAFAEPVAKHRFRQESVGNQAGDTRLGPRTPWAILAQRSANRASPPESYSFSVEHPFDRPPNWLLFSFWSSISLSVYCVLAAFLGQIVAFLTSGLSPPSRANTRWAVGLVTATLVLTAFVMGDSWVRQDVSHSGVVGAWAPLLVPLLGLWVLMWLAQRRVAATDSKDPG